MRRICKYAGGIGVTLGLIIILGTIGADDYLVTTQGAGMPWSELILRIMSGLTVCGLGGLAVMVGSVIR